MHGKPWDWAGRGRLEAVAGDDGYAEATRAFARRYAACDPVAQRKAMVRRAGRWCPVIRVRRVLGFTCATLLDDGVQEMVEEFKKGTYGHYKAETYSNVRTTQKALTTFRDPRLASKLYRPLVELPDDSSANPPAPVLAN